MPPAGSWSGAQAEEMLAEVFSKAGWKVERLPRAGPSAVDLLVRRGKHRYLVEVKCAPEGRRDRLIPLLSQAILQVRRLAQGARKAFPLAVVVAPRVPASVAEEAKRFALENASDVAVGVMSLDGFYAFFGPGLEELKAKGRPPRKAHVRRAEARPNLFSDLNQWM